MGLYPKDLRTYVHMNAISDFTYYYQNIDVNQMFLSQCKDQFSSVQLLSCDRLFATP